MSTVVSIVVFLAVGALVGWLAGLITKNDKGLLVNIVIGVVGSALGGWLAGQLGIGGGWFVTLLMNVAGAVILVILLRFVLKLVK